MVFISQRHKNDLGGDKGRHLLETDRAWTMVALPFDPHFSLQRRIVNPPNPVLRITGVKTLPFHATLSADGKKCLPETCGAIKLVEHSMVLGVQRGSGDKKAARQGAPGRSLHSQATLCESTFPLFRLETEA